MILSLVPNPEFMWFGTALIIQSHSSLNTYLTSVGFYLAMFSRKGASSKRAVSFLQSNQLQILIPLSGWSKKFSATLSTIMTFETSQPSLLRSFKKINPHGVACYQ